MLDLRVRNEVDVRLVKRIWGDEGFKKRFLQNPTATYREELTKAGAELPARVTVKVVEESDKALHLVLPENADQAPEFGPLNERSTRAQFEGTLIRKAAKDDSFRRELLKDAKAAYQQLLGTIKAGATLPADVQVRAHQETADLVYFRIPQVPEGVELSDRELEQVAGGAIAVGVVVTNFGPSVVVLVGVGI